MVFLALIREKASSEDIRYLSFLENRNGKYLPIDSMDEGCRNLLNRILEPDPDVFIYLISIDIQLMPLLKILGSEILIVVTAFAFLVITICVKAN